MLNCGVVSQFFKEQSIEFAENFPLKGKSTYKTGGNARFIAFPDNAEKVRVLTQKLLDLDEKYRIIGAGSNLLIADSGYDGVVISTEKLKGVTVKGKIVTCGAGEKLKDFLSVAHLNSLGGVEFLSGIPATVGGAVAMNAGCFGKNAGDYVSYVSSASGIYNSQDCRFGYRTSRFKDGKDCIITVCFNLENVEYDQSESKMAYFLKLRRGKQPKGRSCGSVFKNDGYFAGRVIESCNLKGFRIGTAKVSEKHANFILADENAKSADISRLINYIKKTVKEKSGILLEEELEYLGDFGDENQS
ncbi:MAG: UDP-N-acetylmuramate dehydrogenase [Clostridiales bacterium]|nr:UDP-N-acetylmuramate dehydrogenase [Clostridiales bacterium]